MSLLGKLCMSLYVVKTIFTTTTKYSPNVLHEDTEVKIQYERNSIPFILNPEQMKMIAKIRYSYISSVS